MSVNKIILVGNIGSDSAEVRQVGQNVVAKFSVATSERWRKQDGTTGEETTWHRVELWGNAGVHPYLVKGQTVYIEGAYKTNDWTDQQGAKHRDYFVKAFTVQLIGKREQQAAPAAPQPPMPPQAPVAPRGGYQQPMPPQPGQPGNTQYPPMDAPAYSQSQTGDLPF